MNVVTELLEQKQWADLLTQCRGMEATELEANSAEEPGVSSTEKKICAKVSRTHAPTRVWNPDFAPPTQARARLVDSESDSIDYH